MLPTPGTKAPEFTLPSDQGGSVSLKSLRGSPVVLYFYPKDDTSGCTTEACEFRDAWSDVKASGARLFGVSPDGIKSHKKFRDKFNLPFTLLADTDHAVAEQYGVWQQRSLYGRKFMGIARTTFLIGPDGKVRKRWDNVKVDGHAEAVAEALAGA